MLSWIKAHWGCTSVIVILILFCAFLLYSWLDAIISLDYARQENGYQHKDIKVLESLLLETGKGMKRSELRQLVMKRFAKEHLIKEEEQNELSVDNIILEFDGDSLVKVRSLNE